MWSVRLPYRVPVSCVQPQVICLVNTLPEYPYGYQRMDIAKCRTNRNRDGAGGEIFPDSIK